ncbi:MAG: hypothetical protein JSV96_13900 [Candidatus Aminicenantes bacterium]|nr:MAG: hypothetical protein JSV96_13900 [Candidatus Aminicenantes bacterium]
MSLTLNQFLLLVITVAVVVAVTFLITLFVQFRKTAKEGERTLVELRKLINNLKETEQKVNTKIDDLDDVFNAAKKTAVSISEIALFLSSKIIKPSSKFWPILFPILRIGWRRFKKRKEDKNVK